MNGVTNTGVAGMTKVSYPRLTSENWNIFLWKWRTHIEIQIYLKVIIFFLDWPNMRRQREATV